MPVRHHPLGPIDRPEYARGWVKPALLFVLGLAVGAVASVLRLARHPVSVATADADTGAATAA